MALLGFDALGKLSLGQLPNLAQPNGWQTQLDLPPARPVRVRADFLQGWFLKPQTAAISYAAFSVPQDDGYVAVQMVGY